LWQIFKQLDTDGSGSLTHSEVEKLLTNSELRGLGFAPSGSEIQEIITGLDKDGNGHVRFDEFCEYINPYRGTRPKRAT